MMSRLRMWSLMMRQSAICRIIFEENNEGGDGEKDILHANKWNVYNKVKEALVNVGYSVEVSDKDGQKIILEAVNDHVVEEGFEHEELSLHGFDFNLF